MTRETDDFTATISEIWFSLPPSGTNVAAMTDSQKTALRRLSELMGDGNGLVGGFLGDDP